MAECKVNLDIKVNGKDYDDFKKEVDELVETLEKAKSLVEDLSSDMASIKFEIVKHQ